MLVRAGMGGMRHSVMGGLPAGAAGEKKNGTERNGPRAGGQR
jgi:hypothetical protein